MAAGSNSDDRIALNSIHFQNFKGLRDFTLGAQAMNILVGPNNAGKSTVISAFRLLAAGLTTAGALGTQTVEGPMGRNAHGYNLPRDPAPTSLVNVHTDYSETASTITFRFSNDHELVFFFPKDGGCTMLPDSGSYACVPTGFRRLFPFHVTVIPVLGPLDDEEPVLQQKTVMRNLPTPRASHNFRSFWFHNPELFGDFQRLIAETWPNMTIEPPERVGIENLLAMFCREDGATRELSWVGFGFQIWCQILTHVVRAQTSDVLVVDEPEIYLHPELQRQLLTILRNLGPDIIVATHSSDIVADAEPQEIVIIDKRNDSGRRVISPHAIDDALAKLGSSQNTALTQLARHRRVLFVEGDDYAIIRKFAGRCGFLEIASATGMATLPIGGFPTGSKVREVEYGIEEALGKRVAFAGIFDHDYYCDEQLMERKAQLKPLLDVLHFWSRKEIENYLLVPAVLDRSLAHALADRAQRTNSRPPKARSAESILEDVSQQRYAATRSQYAAKWIDYAHPKGVDNATAIADANDWLDARWQDLRLRLEIIGGKQALADFNTLIQRDYQVSLTVSSILEELRGDEAPHELRQFLKTLDAFRRAEPPAGEPRRLDR